MTKLLREIQTACFENSGKGVVTFGQIRVGLVQTWPLNWAVVGVDSWGGGVCA